MKNYEIIQIQEAGSDCVAKYKIKFYEQYTVKDFITEILRQGEWGDIVIDNVHKLKYKKDKIISGNPILVYYPAVIKSCIAHGGWGMMHYYIET